MSRRLQYIIDHAGTRLAESAFYDPSVTQRNLFDFVQLSEHPDRLLSINTWLVNQLATADPTHNKRYLQWLVNKYIHRDFLIEDVDRICQELQDFDVLKPQLAEKDINKYKSIRDVYVVVQEMSAQPAEKSNRQIEREYEQSLFDSKSADLMYRSPTLTVIIPRTQEASNYFGRGTRWCTAATRSTNHFDSYNRRGPLYIVILPPGKYQFQFETDSFMDSMDSRIQVGSLIRQYPELKTAFDDVATRIGYLPLVLHVTPQVVLNAINGSTDEDRVRDILQSVDPAVHDEQIALSAIRAMGASARRILREDLLLLPSVGLMLVTNNPSSFVNIPPSAQTSEMARAVVSRSPTLLRHVRPDLIDYELCFDAIKRSPTALAMVPSHLLTDVLIQRAIDGAPDVARSTLPSLIKDPAIRDRWRKKMQNTPKS